MWRCVAGRLPGCGAGQICAANHSEPMLRCGVLLSPLQDGPERRAASPGLPVGQGLGEWFRPLLARPDPGQPGASESSLRNDRSWLVRVLPMSHTQWLTVVR